MSESPRWTEICESEKSIALDAGSICIPLSAVPSNPIDSFYEYLAALIPLGTEDQLKNNSVLGKVLMLGIVSATEHYFRSVLSGLVYMCPIVRNRAASLPVSFGAIEYYSSADIGLAIFEHVSLADPKEIQKLTFKLIGVQVDQDNSVKAAFAEFDKLCQMRHAAVHSRGDLGIKNLQDLGVKTTTGRRLEIRLELSSLHSAASVCQNVIRAYNRLIYRKTLEAWIANRIFSGVWAQDRERFTPVFAFFHSKADNQGYSTAYLAYRAILPIMAKALTAGIPT